MLRISVLTVVTFLFSVILSAVLVFTESSPADGDTISNITRAPSPTEIFSEVFASVNAENIR